MCITRRTSFNGKLLLTVSGAPRADEKGSALVTVLIILVVLTLLGVISIRTSVNEMKISTSDRRHRTAFYNADGATELATELLSQNIEEGGFTITTADYDTITGVFGGLIQINNPSFWENADRLATTPRDDYDPEDASDDEFYRDFYMPANYAAGQAHTNFTVGGHPEMLIGGSTIQAAGYEGLGKGGGGAGAMNVFEVITQRVGANNSESIVRVQWRHVN
jgi:hypothetical protein